MCTINEYENFEEDFEIFEISDKDNNVIVLKDTKEVIIECDKKTVPHTIDEQNIQENEEQFVKNQIETETEISNDKDESNKSDSFRRTEEHKNTTSGPLIPLERPIILPGGIIWRKPVDAFPQVNPNDLSDEFISETLSSQSEILSGKVIG